MAIALTDMNTLKVTGYLVMRMMGRTLTWKRAPDDLPSCAQNAAVTVPPKTATKTPAVAKAAPQQAPKVSGDGAGVPPAASAKPATPKASKTADKAPAPAKASAQEQLPWAEK